MDFTEAEVTEVRFYGMVNEHIASKMIQTQSIYFFVSLKTTKKERKKETKASAHTESRSRFT